MLVYSSTSTMHRGKDRFHVLVIWQKTERFVARVNIHTSGELRASPTGSPSELNECRFAKLPRATFSNSDIMLESNSFAVRSFCGRFPTRTKTLLDVGLSSHASISVASASGSRTGTKSFHCQSYVSFTAFCDLSYRSLKARL